MDSEGYLPITLIASFHRVQALSTDFSVVMDAIKDSEVLEMNDFKVCFKIQKLVDKLMLSIILILPRSIFMNRKGIAYSGSISGTSPQCMTYLPIATYNCPLVGKTKTTS
jgi:hypothetical protein